MTYCESPVKPLHSVRVLDLTRILAGPTSTQILADLGAEVIKVERPGAGDDTRSWGPPYASGPDGAREAAYFLGVNRGKKSLSVDLKSEAGQRIVRQLALRSDVIVENFKTGDLARYGLDHATLSKTNPGLIYCSITGFGQTGPRAPQAGYDLLVQGMAGLMSITGQPEMAEGGEPMKVGVAVVDVLTGLYATISILAALQERAVSWVGRQIDLSLFDVCAASLANQASNWLAGGVVPQRMGNAHPSIAPYQTFSAADGYIILAVGNDGQFVKLCNAIGRSDLRDDPRFATNPNRVANRAALIDSLNAEFSGADRAHWIALLEPIGVPCGPINNVNEVFEDPQALARGLAVTLPHAALGQVKTVASPIRLDGVSVTAESGPPILGEHSDEVLRGVLGMSSEQVAALIAEGVVALPTPHKAPA